MRATDMPGVVHGRYAVSKSVRRSTWAAFAVFLAGCDSEYPSRDWSGNYIARMIASSSDCVASPLPPPLTSFQLQVTQSPDNTVTVWMNPIITLTGKFDGDRLEVDGMLREELSLPDTLRARITPADSFDAVAYRLEARFEDLGFGGNYEIRTPDIRALVHGDDDLRCSYRYELTGTRFEPQSLGEQPWIRDLAPVGPAEPLTAPPDSPAAADAIGAPAESL
ncbi:MAG: hypothetical protein ABR527_07275 [Gemmatimonadota bacterium]